MQPPEGAHSTLYQHSELPGALVGNPLRLAADHWTRRRCLERTLVLIKPDAVQRGLTFAILGRLEARGLKLVGMKMLAVPEDLARRHYAEHEGKPFYNKLIGYITSSPIVAAVFEGTRASAVMRSTVG